MTVRDPFTQQPLLEIPLANKEDLNEAYARAQAAQPGWAATGPSARAEVLLGAARFLMSAMTNWLIGSFPSQEVRA